MTKKLSISFAILVLVLASLACQTLSGGGGGDVVPPEYPAPSNDGGDEPQPETNGGGGSDVKTDFPIPVGATNIQDLGGTINFQVEMSLEAAMGFYRNEFTVKGYTERPILTVTSETTFSMVFDGHASGKAIVVQGVDMGDGTVNVNIRLEDV